MMFSDGIGEQPSGEVWPTCGHSRYRACDGRTMKGSSISAVHFQRSAHPRSAREFPLVRGCVWSGAGSNRRPSAFQVNRAKRCTDLRKRMSLTSGTTLGGRCSINASRTQYTPSTRQDSAPTQDHRDRRRRDHGRHPVGARRWHVRSFPTPRGHPPHSRKQATLRRASPTGPLDCPTVSATARARSRPSARSTARAGPAR